MIKEFINPASIFAKAFPNSHHWIYNKDFLTRDPENITGTKYGIPVFSYTRNSVEATIFLVSYDETRYPMRKRDREDARVMMTSLSNLMPSLVPYADCILVGRYKYVGKTEVRNLCLPHENIGFFNAIEILAGYESVHPDEVGLPNYSSLTAFFGRAFALSPSDIFKQPTHSFGLHISDLHPSVLEFRVKDGVQWTTLAKMDFVEDTLGMLSVRQALTMMLRKYAIIPAMFTDVLEMMFAKHWWNSGYASTNISKNNVFQGFQTIEFAPENDSVVLRLVGDAARSGIAGMGFHTTIPLFSDAA